MVNLLRILTCHVLIGGEQRRSDEEEILYGRVNHCHSPCRLAKLCVLMYEVTYSRACDWIEASHFYMIRLAMQV